MMLKEIVFSVGELTATYLSGTDMNGAMPAVEAMIS
jgi:hypothetical protein